MIELKGSRIPREDSKSCCAKCQCEVSTPNLLTIELTDEQSMPRVIYKGEELTGKVAIEFLWHTDNADGKVPTYINIEKHNGNCNIERITYNPDSAEVKRYNLYGDPVDE